MDGIIKMEMSVILNNTQNQSSTSVCGPLPSWKVVYLVIAFIGTVSNILIMIVVVFSKKKASIFMTLLNALAIADNLYLWVVIFIEDGVFGCIFLSSSVFFRQLGMFLSCWIGITSSWLIVLISLERCIAVFYPLKIRLYCTMKRMYVSVFVLTTSAFIVSISSFFTCSIKLTHLTPICSVRVYESLQDLIILVVVGCFYSFFPFCIVSAVNISIIKKMRRQSAFLMTLQRQNIRQPSFSQNTSLVTMMVAVCLVFAVTSFPASVILMTTYACRFFKGEFCISLDGWLFSMSLILDEINHSVNFFLYCISGSVFRNAFCNIFRCKGKNNTMDNVHNLPTVS